MYLASLSITNFRIFGDGTGDEPSLALTLNRGLNLIVGENDCGKTAVIDAIRLLLGTRDNEWMRITTDDFHVSASGRAKTLRIEAQFEDLDQDEAAAFLEWLGLRQPDGSALQPAYYLRVWLDAERKDVSELQGRFDREITVTLRAGPDTEGKRLEGDAREFLRATYLKPLRDAEQELSARRGSRLSQVLLAHPEMKGQDKKDDPETIVGIVVAANKSVSQHPSISGRVNTLNQDYLANFILSEDTIAAAVSISDPDLRSVLERLILTLTDDVQATTSTPHGLGLNNLLFIATELLLLQRSKAATSPLLLIEEPEAHLHPQLQLRLIEFLEQQAGRSEPETRPIQAIMTSHSPNLTSMVDLERLIIMRRGRAYSLTAQFTRLDVSDYGFLKRFLDVTRASLLFARGVLIVEGDAEHILLPTLAKRIGRPLSRHGVTVVNVGHTGLFRYAKIFQRQDGLAMDIRVSCVTDLDIPPLEAKAYLGTTTSGKPRRTEADMEPGEAEKRRKSKVSKPGGEPVRTFVSPQWTLEHDIALAGLALEMHVAIQLAVASKTAQEGPSVASDQQVTADAIRQYRSWRRGGKTRAEIAALVYQPLYEKQASKVEAAQYLAGIIDRKLWTDRQAERALRTRLPIYLLEAIDYVTRNNARPDSERLGALNGPAD